MNPYVSGTYVLGVNVIPKAETYTDHDTVLAVQRALKAKGYDLGSTGPNHDGLDGEFGPHTSAAIKKFQSASGIPETGVVDYGVLLALGISPPSNASSSVDDGSAAAPLDSSSADGSGEGYAHVFTPPGAPARSAAASTPPTGFWGAPLFQGSPVKRWQGAVGAGGLLALVGGLVWIGARK